jgi:NADPH:quinone reductase-like Zn-dependent oxidoreductase
MKAVQLHGYGGVEQLAYEEVPTPRPGNGEVLVRMLATSINPIDYKIRSGRMKQAMPVQFPLILGYDVAGEVAQTGEGVSGFRIGDRVMGMVNNSHAEFLVAKADTLAKVPEGLDLQKAGVIPTVTLTGAQLIEKGVQPVRGQTILVTGAAGSVGRTALFVAKQHGAKTVAGIRARQKDDAQSLGADMLIALDKDEELSAAPDLDAIADTINGDTIGKLLPHLKKGGVLGSVLVGKPAAAEKAGIRVNAVVTRPDSERLYQLACDVRDGRLKIPIARTFKLNEIRRAHELAEKGGVAGKILIIP